MVSRFRKENLGIYVRVFADESVAVDPVKNALKLYQKLGILECHQEGKLRLYYLNEAFDNPESVKLFYNKVNKYRTGNLLIQ